MSKKLVEVIRIEGFDLNMRVLNTEGRIQAGLFRAMNQKPLIMIKDKDVIENAHVASGTFYKYYSDHTEVLQSIEKELINRYRKALNASSKQWLGLTPSASKEDIFNLLKNHTEELIDYFLKNAKTIVILTSSKGDPAFMSMLTEILGTVVKRVILYYFKNYGKGQLIFKAPKRIDFITYKFSMTFISSILYFLNHANRFSKETMKKYTIRLLLISPYNMTQHGF